MCGENIYKKRGESPAKGSPPRVRGKLAIDDEATLKRGITPACAGKTHYIRNKLKKFRDHPRVCGENLTKVTILLFRIGSPPRVRGKPNGTINPDGHGRITPACAGKTSDNFLYSARRGDHPRVCGENGMQSTARLMIIGSPPRVRGKLKVKLRRRVKNRITPACAGKTIAETLGRDAKEDHPRVCGENAFLRSQEADSGGSPPRVRGKPSAFSLVFVIFGITPACAGKTLIHRHVGVECEDHPRVCGENSSIMPLL